ncbi:MAG: helix-turn-helix domain-containing protein [Marmoricola sp.]
MAGVEYTWRLREVMAAHGVWKTTDLGPLLADRGVELSAAQVYRLAAKVPERLSLRILAALCDIFDCTPNDLIETTLGRQGAGPPPAGSRTVRAGSVVELASAGRPRRAQVVPRSS